MIGGELIIHLLTYLLTSNLFYFFKINISYFIIFLALTLALILTAFSLTCISGISLWTLLTTWLLLILVKFFRCSLPNRIKLGCGFIN